MALLVLASSAFAAVSYTGWQLLSDEVVEYCVSRFAGETQMKEDFRKHYLENASLKGFNCDFFLPAIENKVGVAGWYPSQAKVVVETISTPRLMNMFWGAKKAKILAEIRENNLEDEVVVLIDRLLPFWDGSYPHTNVFEEEDRLYEKWEEVENKWDDPQYNADYDKLQEKKDKLGVTYSHRYSYEFVERQRARNADFPSAVARILRQLRSELK